MASEVSCNRCGQTRAGIVGLIPFRGELREKVQEHICQPCWSEWLEEQVRVINELALNLGDPRSHEIIEQRAQDFLGLSGKPPESTTGTPPEA